MFDISFILVEPGLPENIGAAARALNTMGFTSLKIINGYDHLDKRAQWMAHGSVKVLENAQTYSTLSDAIQDRDLIIASTARNRNGIREYIPCSELPVIINKKKSSLTNIGIVFGSEKNGLSNRDIAYCDIISTIPMHMNYPSLNLSQAVMVYAYTLSQFSLNPKTTTANQQPQEFLILKQKLHGLLSKIDFYPESNLYKSLIERMSLLGKRDLRLIHAFCNKVMDKLHE
jgi:tRNA/rRNA methyltransferase